MPKPTQLVPFQTIASLLKTRGPKKWRKVLARWTYAMEDGVVLHEGDLKAAKLGVGPAPLVVTGNVRVSGLVEDGHRADETILVVLGDLEAANVISYGAIFVAGNVRVKQTLYGSSAHDRIFCVGGGLAAKTIIDGDHFFEVHGALDVELMVADVDAGLRLAAGKAKPRRALDPAAALIASACDEDGIDRERLPKLIRSGKPLLLTKPPPGPVDRAKRTKKLEFTRHVTAIPDTVFALSALETLDLSNQPLRVVSPRIGELRSLRELDLGNTPIQKLPDSIGRLTALTHLNLRFCKHLRQLPATFGDLAALEMLELHATLRGFAPILARLPKLKKLHWTGVETVAVAESIVKCIGKLPQIREVAFDMCELTRMPADLTPLRTLKRFDIWTYSKELTAPEKKRLAKALPNGRVSA